MKKTIVLLIVLAITLSLADSARHVKIFFCFLHEERCGAHINHCLRPQSTLDILLLPML